MIARRSLFGLLPVFLSLWALPVLAASPPVYSNAANGLAIGGYDPVAYFTESTHVEGSADFSTEWNGATWHFSSEANRDMFVSDPEAYAPQYGGYCAFAMAHNALATTDPAAWTVRDGKLYLNYSLGVRNQWQTDPDGFISKADGFWPGPLGQ